MRKDEEFIINAITMSGVLDCTSSYEVCLGDEPPDYYISTPQKRIAVEITQCRPLVYDPHKRAKVSSTSFSTPLLRYIAKLNHLLENKYANSDGVRLWLSYPIDDYQIFTKSLTSNIDSLLQNEFYGKDEGFFDVAHEHVKWQRIKQRTGNLVVGAVQAKQGYHQIRIDYHVHDMVAHALKTKHEKMRNIDPQKADCFWLGILNGYFLADNSTFKEIIELECFDYCFEKIFIVNTDGQVDCVDCI